jgi:hypothetical protein
VEVKLENLLQNPDEFVSSWYFNSIVSPGTISPVSPGSGTGFSALSSIAFGSDCCNADGGGSYDIVFYFKTAAGDRFIGGEVMTTTLTRAAGLDENNFNILASPHGGNGPFFTAAHVQGIVGGAGSTFVAGIPASSVPEPSAVLLLGTGLVFAGAAFRKRFAR